MRKYYLPDGTILTGVHDESLCAHRTCVIHNPTDHHMQDWSLSWDDHTGLFYRQCPHGDLVIDPDQYDYLQDEGRWDSVELRACGYIYRTWGPEIECGYCGDTIQSQYRHHLKSCSCGKTFIDGGSSYTRVGGDNWSFTEAEETNA